MSDESMHRLRELEFLRAAVCELEDLVFKVYWASGGALYGDIINNLTGWIEAFAITPTTCDAGFIFDPITGECIHKITRPNDEARKLAEKAQPMP